MNRLALPLAALAAAAALAAVPARAPGCAAAPRENESVSVAHEVALIVWDEAAKTEHFIRRAAFEATSYDFGFLVPTPNRPQLAEADPDLYTELGRLTAPKTVYQTVEVREEVGFGGSTKTAQFAASAADRAEAPGGGFAVLEQRRVGDLDAAVLGFKPGAELAPRESAADLIAWLARNGYAVRPDLLDWIAVYAKQRWVVTAFKIAGRPPLGDAGGAVPPPVPPKEARPRGPVALNSTAVRMSFKADRPFYPYREPAGQRAAKAENGTRLLRVFVAARERVAGKLGDGSVAWPGQTVWADAVPDETRAGLLAKAKLPADAAPGPWRLTEFEDHSAPRPGTDEVYFEPAADQSAVARPPHVVPQYVTVRVFPDWFGPVAVLVPFTLLVAGVLVARRPSLRR